MSLSGGVLAMLTESMTAWGPRPVIVGAGRNFQIEENLLALNAEVISWGDSLYEWAYGRYLTDEPFDLRFNPEYVQRISFLPPMNSSLDKITALVLATQLRNAFHSDEILELMRLQWENLWNRSRLFVLNRKMPIAKYMGPDAVHGNVSKMLSAPAYVYVPQQVVQVAEEVFISNDWKSAFSHDAFEKQVIATTRNAHPFFMALTKEDENLSGELMGRVMLGATSLWVYSSHGSPAVLREEKPVTPPLSLFDGSQPHVWRWQFQDVAFGAFKSHYERVMRRELPERVVRSGRAYILLVDGELWGGWCVRLAPDSASIIVDGLLPFAIGTVKGSVDLIEGAMHSLDARLLYESHFSSRVQGVRYNMMTHVYPQRGPLEFIHYLEDWRSEYYSKNATTKHAD